VSTLKVMTLQTGKIRPPQANEGARLRRSGFVLLVTLVLIMLAALAMITISRAAILRMQAASEAQVELQRRWGCLGFRSILLPHCQDLLGRAELQRAEPVPVLHRTLILGDQTFKLTFSDESAKVNAGFLIRRQGKDQAELTVRRLSLGSPLAAGNVHLRIPPGSSGPKCFGDVFDGRTPKVLFDNEMGSSPLEVLTCWGDGRVNIHRASEAVLREVCAGTLDLTQIHLLYELQTSQPSIGVRDALKQIQLSAKQRQDAEEILTDGSTSSSLWIECQTKRRSYWVLAVSDHDQGSTPAVSCFEW
jgi:hypothetical protein